MDKKTSTRKKAGLEFHRVTATETGRGAGDRKGCRGRGPQSSWRNPRVCPSPFRETDPQKPGTRGFGGWVGKEVVEKIRR